MITYIIYALIYIIVGVIFSSVMYVIDFTRDEEALAVMLTLWPLCMFIVLFVYMVTTVEHIPTTIGQYLLEKIEEYKNKKGTKI